MKFFHFHIHDWSKWEEYIEHFKKHTPPLGKFGLPQNNWYAYDEKWDES